MRILLVGDPNSRFVTDYAKNLGLHFRQAATIDFCATGPFTATSLPGIGKVITLPRCTFLNRLSTLKFLYRAFALKRVLRESRGRYDAVHVLYAIQDLALMPGTFSRVAPRRVITVFGSDFTRLSPFRRSLMAPVFGQATSVTFANPATMEAFRLHYGFPAEKLRLCRFGLEPLELLMKISMLPVAASLSALGLPAGKTIITVGYNFNSIQQHLPVIQILANNHELLKRKEALLFVFPLTYGTEKEYLKKLKQALESFPYPFITFESYLSEEDNAHLRRSSDIMLQMQQHDQFSGSMQEYLFAGCLVITGSWLDYRVLSDEGAYFRSVGALSEVGAELNLCLDHLAEEKLKCKANEAVISRLSSWNETLPGWINLYLG